MTDHTRREHVHQHAFFSFNALEPEGLTLLSRRNMLKAGDRVRLAIAGLGAQEQVVATG